MIELTSDRLMRVVKKTKARVHTSLINLTMVIRYTVILADKHTMQNKKKFLLEVKHTMQNKKKFLLEVNKEKEKKKWIQLYNL